MAKKSSSQQSSHDRTVKNSARQLQKEGWNVKAHLPGREKPDPIGKNKYVPDIQAERRGHRKLIEVETPKSLEKDSKQQEAFRRSAAQRSNTTFEIVITDKE